MTSMTHDNDQHVSLQDETFITARDLVIRGAGGVEVFWRETGDAGMVLKQASKTHGMHLPSGQGGYVIVGLNADGEDYHEVVTQQGTGAYDNDHIDVLDEAIRALEKARDGIQKSQGLTVGQLSRAADKLGCSVAEVFEALEPTA